MLLAEVCDDLERASIGHSTRQDDLFDRANAVEAFEQLDLVGLEARQPSRCPIAVDTEERRGIANPVHIKRVRRPVLLAASSSKRCSGSSIRRGRS
jgi:hypothetical protein